VEEALPCFRWRQLWYGLYILKDADALKSMSSETQLDWINRLFTGASIASLKKARSAAPADGIMTR
jgi:hypothetical protein